MRNFFKFPAIFKTFVDIFPINEAHNDISTLLAFGKFPTMTAGYVIR